MARGFAITRSARTSIILGAFALVLGMLGYLTPGYWNDEAASVSAASRPLPDLLGLVGHVDLVHSQYYLLLHGWGRLFEWEEVSTRLLSVLCYALATGLVHRLAIRLVGTGAANPAAVLFAVLPGVATSAIEARGFMLTTLLTIGAVLALDVACRRSTWRDWARYAVLLALAIWGEVYVVLALPALLLLATRHRQLRRASAASGLVLLVLLPFVIATARQSEQLPARVGFGLLGLPGTVLHSTPFVGPRDPVSPVPLQTPASYLLMAVVLGLIGVAVWHRRDEHGLIGALLWWALVPSCLVYIASLPDGSTYAGRYFVFCAPAIALLAGAGASQVRPRWRGGAAIALAVLAAVPLLVAARQPTAKSGQDYRAVAEAVRRLAALDSPARASAVLYSSPTARGVAITEPAAFARLADLSLARGRVDDESLWGANNLPAESARMVDGRVVLLMWVTTEGRVNPTSSALMQRGCRARESRESVMLSVTRFDCTAR